MKRVLLHIIFWVVYLLQDIWLEYTWIGASAPTITSQQLFWRCLGACLVMLIPKLILTYYLLLVVVRKSLQHRLSYWGIALEAALAFMVCIVIYRWLFVILIDNIFFKDIVKPRHLLDISRVLMAVMDMGFVCGAAVMFKLLRVQLVVIAREKQLVKEKLETELKFLRNQINPHFLFNTLNNIYALSRKKSDKTPEIVMKLSKLLRFMLYESRKQLIPVAEEIKMLDDCLDLERIRYNERLTITFEKEIDNGQQLIAPLLLLPFVENAFKHGVSETRFASFIHIVMHLRQGKLTFTVENSKESGEPVVVTDNIGLSNVRRQLELMYKDYQLLVENEDTVFKVYLTINLNSHAEI